MEKLIFPERTCTVCGRFLVLNYRDCSSTHLVGRIFDPWTKKMVYSTFSLVDEAQKHLAQQTEILDNDGVRCLTYTHFVHRSAFDNYLAFDTQVCHVGSEVNFFSNDLMAVKMHPVSSECLFFSSVKAKYFIFIDNEYTGEVFGYVPVSVSGPLLTKSLEVLNIRDSTLYFYREYFTWLFMYYRSLQCGTTSSSWVIVRLMTIDDVWRCVCERELVAPVGFDYIDDVYFKRDLIETMSAVFISIRRVYECGYFRKNWKILDIGSSTAVCPARRNSGDEGFGCYAYCEYVDCPFCEPRSDAVETHEYVAKLMCWRLGTLAAC